MDKPSKTIHRFLISTPSLLIGDYESTDLRIDHAWPFHGSLNRIRQGWEEGPHSRNYFVISLNVEEAKPTIAIPDYTHVADRVCAVLSVYYGKRFDNHGPLISHGIFGVPELSSGSAAVYFSAAPFSHKPRKDFEVPLDLRRFPTIAPMLFTEQATNRFNGVFFTAARFYLRALQVFDHQPEFAYLDLITSGEIIASYKKIPQDVLLDEDTKRVLCRIESEIKDGPEIARRLRGKMRQIRRAFSITLSGLLTDVFYLNSECATEVGQLRRDQIENRLKASYDLRSEYVHSGIQFGGWMQPRGPTMDEVQVWQPSVGDKALAKALFLAPTFLGMERIVRFALLRMIHLEAISLDPKLDDTRSGADEQSVAPERRGDGGG